MQVVEIIGASRSFTLRQRWSHVFTILIAFVMLLFGINLRSSILNASTTFSSTTAGIRAEYPQNWLLDTSGGYIFRVRDMSRSGFKTAMQVSVLPIGSDSTERSVANRLNLDRLQTFPLYTVLSNVPYSTNELTGQSISYTYVTREGSPFLETVPLVVRGQDIIIIQGGQAVVITFRADFRLYESELPRFEEFVRRLSF